MTDRGRISVHITVIGAVCLLVMGRQILEPGVYSCLRDDTIYFLNWVRQAADGMASGIYYPRWMADSHSGYGNPVFFYYPPLVVFATSGLLLAGGSIAFSATAVKVAGMLVSGLFMYRLLLKFYVPHAALAGAVLYMIMPYRVYEMYFLGMHASKLAYVWYPPIIYYLHMTISPGRKSSHIALLGLSFGLLCLTHILSAYMLLFVMAAYTLLVPERGNRAICGFYAAAGVLLGLAAAAIYLLPALAGEGYVHFGILTSPESFPHFRNFLFETKGLTGWFHGYLSMTVLITAGIGGSLLLAGWPPAAGPAGRAVYALGVALVFETFMMTSLSTPLWDHLPGMATLQFPMRWSSPLVFCSAFLAASGVDGFLAHGKNPMKLIALIFACLFVIPGGRYVYDSISKGCVFTNEDIAGLPRDTDVYEYVPADVSISWLKDAEKKKEIPRATLYGPGKNDKLIVREWAPEERVMAFHSKRDRVVRVRTFYYPGWRAFSGYRELTVRPEPVSGAMLIEAPAGSYDIRLTLTCTALRLAARVISLTGIAVILALLVGGIPNRKRPY